MKHQNQNRSFPFPGWMS